MNYFPRALKCSPWGARLFYTWTIENIVSTTSNVAVGSVFRRLGDLLVRLAHATETMRSDN